MQLYYLSLFVFILCSAVAAQQSCGPLNTTFSGYPHVCYLSYDVSYPEGKNSTGGDALYDLFASMTTNETRVSRTCAEAFAAYYCNYFYPECIVTNTSSTVKPQCSSTCLNVLQACDADKDKLQNSTILPYPTVAVCNSLSADASGCSTPPATNLSASYCETPDQGNYDVQTPSDIICAVNYSMIAVITNNSYTDADAVWNTFRDISQFGPDANGMVNDSYKDCFQAFSNFYCGKAFPQCPADGNPKDVLPICREACQIVISECDPFTKDFTDIQLNYHGLPIPTVADCNKFPLNSSNNCFMPIVNDTNLAFFFSGGGPIPTPTPEPKPVEPGIIYPPGGPGKGAGLGVGVLIILLLIIGGIMLIMKKQDSR